MEEVKTKPSFKKLLKLLIPLLSIASIVIIAIWGTAWYMSTEQQIKRFDGKIAQVQKKYDESIKADIKCDYNRVNSLYNLNKIKQEKYQTFGTHNDTEIIHYEKLQSELPEIESWRDNLQSQLNSTSAIPVVKASDIVSDYELVISDTDVYIVRKGSQGLLNDDKINEMNEAEISKLAYSMQSNARIFLNRAKVEGITLLITDGLRTNEQQEYLYSLGRTNGGKIVTNVANCLNNESRHCTGEAIDVVAMVNGKIDYAKTDYVKLSTLISDFNWNWGGNWTSFPDKPHFEINKINEQYVLYNEIDTYLKSYKRSPEDIKNSVDLWVKYGLQEKIKPEVGVCIAVADTGLGDSLKTSYNIGNVGNTDSGQVQYMNSWEHGIESVFKTFNNGKYDNLSMIGELSGNGRIALGLVGCKQATCYATSVGPSGHWNGNVISCLRKLTGDKTINEHYEFKL